MGFLGGSVVKNPPAMQETWVWSLGWKDTLEMEMETHSSILAWKIPWTEEPGRLESKKDCKELDKTEPLSIHSSSVASTICFWVYFMQGFPGGANGKEPACQCTRCKRCGFNPWVGKIPWRKAWQPIPAFLPGESHGQRSLVGYSPWGLKDRWLSTAWDSIFHSSVHILNSLFSFVMFNITLCRDSQTEVVWEI